MPAERTMATIRAESSCSRRCDLACGLPLGRSLEWQGRRRSAEVEFVAAEAVEGLIQIGAGAGKRLGGDRGAMPVGDEAVERACHADDRVEDEQVGDEVVALDRFALLVARGCGRQAAAAEGDPLGGSVEQLALVGGGADGASQFDGAEAAKQEVGPDSPAQLHPRPTLPPCDGTRSPNARSGPAPPWTANSIIAPTGPSSPGFYPPPGQRRARPRPGARSRSATARHRWRRTRETRPPRRTPHGSGTCRTG